MDDEYQLYHQSDSFVRFLTSWSSSDRSLYKRIAKLARDIAQAGFWHSKEVDIIDAWLADLRSVDYLFPSIVKKSSSSPSIKQKRAAICVTGLTECVREGWAPTYTAIRKNLQGDIDTFSFPFFFIQTRTCSIKYSSQTSTFIYEFDCNYTL